MAMSDFTKAMSSLSLRFTRRISVKGGLISTFVFEDQDAVDDWMSQDFLALTATHGHLSCEIEDLDGLEIGDKCCVMGEGSEVFVIKDLVRYADHRYGFLLDSGDTEEVAKCYRPSREVSDE